MTGGLSEARSLDERLPPWLRAVEAAQARAGDNNHAPFRRGELALILGSVDTATGVVRPSTNVTRAVDEAVRLGWLEPGSYCRCLILPVYYRRVES